MYISASLNVDDKTILAVREMKDYTILKFDLFVENNTKRASCSESLYVFVTLGQKVKQVMSEVFIRLYQSFLKLNK